MNQIKYQLAMSSTTDIYIEFIPSTLGNMVLVNWCRGTDRREEFDVEDWFDDHYIPRSFVIEPDSIYPIEVAREIWNALVKHHSMKRRDVA